MNWMLDAALAAIILIIIIINTCKGFKTILNLLVTVVPFGATYFFGLEVGRRFVTDIILEKITACVEAFLTNIINETIDEVTIGEIMEVLPETLIALLEKFGVSLEGILSSFADNLLIDSATIGEISAKIAQPISNALAIAAGCIIVFIAALLVMFLVKALFELLVKLPLLKEVGHILGFVVGLINAALWMWVICMALGILLDGGFLGENHQILVELTENSFIFKFFDDFSLLNLLK